jgi:hypothetical protein
MYRSAEINSIACALAKAQGEYKPLIPNQTYKGEKYANLEAILNATRNALSSNELAFYQHHELLDEGSGAAILKTTLMHSSGQWISSWSRIVFGQTDKETGSLHEFRKRLHALIILGIAPSAHDPYLFDDNGEMQNDRSIIEDMKKPREVLLQEKSYRDRTISNNQYNDLLIELEGHERLTKSILEKHTIESLADLPEGAYHRVLGEIRRIKQVEQHERRKKAE